MNAPSHRQWLRAAAVTGLAYVLIGLVTAALSRTASSPQVRTVWRLAAWGTSAAAFVMHIRYEVRRRTPVSRAALHAAVAVALATFALAAIAVIRQLMTSSLRPSMVLAFAIWPILTGIPAFLVAWGVGAVLERAGKSSTQAPS